MEATCMVICISLTSIARVWEVEIPLKCVCFSPSKGNVPKGQNYLVQSTVSFPAMSVLVKCLFSALSTSTNHFKAIAAVIIYI